jgi:ribonuclease G
LVKELIIDSTPAGVTIALVEDKHLVELHKEHININYAVGDIYLGRIKENYARL